LGDGLLQHRELRRLVLRECAMSQRIDQCGGPLGIARFDQPSGSREQ
jgi:hypothetical protein